MRLMLILLGASVAVYFLSGIGGEFPKMKRLYFAVAAYLVVYFLVMISVIN
jgi:hypothetical protein